MKTPLPITDFLEQNALLFTNEMALIERKYCVNDVVKKRECDHNGDNFNLLFRKILTWSEFDHRANQVANLLLFYNVKKGDKVALLMMNCLEWLPIYFGILKTGALAVPLNYRYTSDELQYCLTLAECSVLIFASDFTSHIRCIRYQIPMVSRFIFVGDNPLDFAEDYNTIINTFVGIAPGINLTDYDLAAIYFSSGTTGFPKAILHNHRSLLAVGKTEQVHHKQTHGDVFLCIPPLYHTGSKMHWFGNLMSGGSAVLLLNISPRWILETVAQEQITIAWLLLPWVQDILDAISSGDVSIEKYDLSCWRLMHMGAQPIPESLIYRWLKQFPNQKYDTNYGLSEAAGPGCVHLGIHNVCKIGAIGQAGYGWETVILDNNKIPVKRGEIGELAVKGDGVMVEYYKNPKSTEEILHNGWLLTGDMAYEDEDEFIYLVDRKKDLIVSGGENIYPIQIENFLRKHSEIKDAAVIGFPDVRLGEIAVAIIELKQGSKCDKKDIFMFCKELPEYKRPRKLIFAPIPRNPTGKIEKNKLRRQYIQ